MTGTVPGSQALTRIPTGLVGLDLVLRGGLLRGDTHLLVGTAGAGKTILSNQLCFARAAAGGRAVYVTLLAEAPEQLIAHLASFSFFDHAAVGEAVSYFSAYGVLEAEGLTGLLKFLWQLIRTSGATLLVLDGLSTAQTAAETPVAFNRFLHDLNVHARVGGCTTILLTQMEQAGGHPEYTLVDSVIELHLRWIGTRTVRELRVVKFRGGAFLEGPHAYYIDDRGMTIVPRTEALYAVPPAGGLDESTRLGFGVASLDKMLGGGLVSGTSTLLLGTPGAGKTLLGLTFLADGARRGESTLSFGFYETPPRLVSLGDQLGLDLSAAIGADRLELLWQPPLENVLDRLAERLLTAVARRKAQRLFIDGFEGFQEASTDPERVGRFLAALTNELRARNVTTIISTELRTWLGPTVEAPVSGLAAVAENVLFLRHVELGAQIYRLISILKQRGSGYDTSIRQFSITPNGIDVAASFRSAAAILTGVAQPLATAGAEDQGGADPAG